ncbi:MAG: DUF2784 domain-containing protein [Marinilabiliaceae bacterium]|jgi:hypothetical protein|nr:DUF2784 domain-containing protein [Marinilabiliaceae bacterium]
MYKLLDIFFLLFHSSLIIFNLFAWIWIKTRKANLITLLLTAGSWVLLGLMVGTMGYCPLTEWHFNVLEKLGAENLPVSYIKYLADRLTGLDFKQDLIDKITLWGLILAMLASVILNTRDYLKRKNLSRSTHPSSTPHSPDPML